MNEQLKANLGNPEMLEKLYRNDRQAFKASFDKIFAEIEGTETAKFWKARLQYDISPVGLRALLLPEVLTVLVICIITGLLIKIPALFNLSYSDEIFYMKNAALIVFFGLVLFTIWLNRITELKKIIITALIFLIAALYINLLPSDSSRASVNLAYIHLPFLMWFTYGIVFTGFEFRDLNKRIDFIRFNGDLVIVYALIAIAGGLLTAVTIGLFSSIGLNIEKFYGETIVVMGAAAAPVVAAFLIEKFPALVSKTAPVIAAIFSPLVLITLIIFLIAMLVTGKDPFNDRDFLLIFNIMLLGVMGIIFFSISETSVIKNQKYNAIILFALSVVTIIIDLIALSAIFYRLGQYGLTPNRLAVLVSNILVLINLIMIMTNLFRINFKRKDFKIVEETVSKFLPVYLVWIIIVIFGFPVIFRMR
jgi:hypothetical protein